MKAHTAVHVKRQEFRIAFGKKETVSHARAGHRLADHRQRLEKVGQENKRQHVSKVTLELGEVSGILNDYLQDCWKWAAGKSELLRGALLEAEILPAVTVCDDCGKTYGTVAHGKRCPYCSGENTHLLSGNEINIKEIEPAEKIRMPERRGREPRITALTPSKKYGGNFMFFQLYGANAAYQLIRLAAGVHAGLILTNEIARRTKAGGIFFFCGAARWDCTAYFIAIYVAAAATGARLGADTIQTYVHMNELVPLCQAVRRHHRLCGFHDAQVQVEHRQEGLVQGRSRSSLWPSTF
jgi:hydrogenase nickel incorporation protein HypA/HybF